MPRTLCYWETSTCSQQTAQQKKVGEGNVPDTQFQAHFSALAIAIVGLRQCCDLLIAHFVRAIVVGKLCVHGACGDAYARTGVLGLWTAVSSTSYWRENKNIGIASIACTFNDEMAHPILSGALCAGLVPAKHNDTSHITGMSNR